MSATYGHYTRMQPKELLHVLISSFFIGVVISFRDWGTQSIDVAAGLESLIISAVVAFAIILLRVMAQKWIALKYGLLTTYTIGKYTLPISIFLAFFLNGFVPFTAAGEIRFKESKRLRLGQFRYGLNYQDMAIISLAGPVLCILLMFIIKPIYMVSENFFIYRIIEVIGYVAFWGLFPINGNEGWHIFYYRRWLWITTFVFVGVYFFLIVAAGVFSYVVAGVLAIIAMWVYQSHFNR